MLAVSDSAAQAIETILEQEHAPEGAGLRIGVMAQDGAEPQLGLGLAAGPAPSDAVVEHNGATVFVSEDVTDVLDDKVLDAESDGQRIAFTMRDQPDL